MIKVKRTRIIEIFLMLALIFNAGCSYGGPMILEKEDTQFLRIEETKADDRALKLTISGLVFHSGLSVSEIETSTLNGKISIIVYLQPAIKGGSGRFEYEIIVSPDVSEVVFGEKRAAIWKKLKGSEN